MDVGFVHPIQAIITTSQSPDFVAIGTYNSGGAQGTCTDDYDPLWSIYVDWQIGGFYDCNLIAQDVYGVGNIVSFQISYGDCTGAHQFR